MSASDSKLTVRMADDAAEIFVIDGNSKTVAKGIGTVEQVLPRGLYKLRIRVGPSVKEELIALDQDKEFDHDILAFPSPIPLNWTSRSHDYHQAAARQASNTARVKLGTGASVLVFAREWSGPKGPLPANPATGLTFWKERGDKPQDIADQADVRMSGDACAGWRADVSPGAYRLRLTLSDGKARERPLFATRGMQTQIFLLQRNHILRDGTLERRADLARGAITISTRQSFDPDDRLVRLSELASYALAQSRKILSSRVMDELLSEKFEDPMLGLFGAHLILRDNPKGLRENADSLNDFRTVTSNLLRLLGPKHPDLQALWWRRGDDSPLSDGRLHSLPMLRASWDLAVDRSFQHPEALALDSSSLATTTRIRPTAPWLVWRADTKSLESQEANALSTALSDYLGARARADASRLPTPQSESVKQSSKKGRGRSSASPQLDVAPQAKRKPKKTLPAPRAAARSTATKAPAREKRKLTERHAAPAAAALPVWPASPAPPAVPALKNEEKLELARTLGVPSKVLDTMLRKYTR